jgi:hypothetical protein
MKYVYKFEITKGGVTFRCSVSNEPKGSIFGKGFHPWFGGCGIGESQKTPDKARKIVYDYLRSRVDDEILKAERRLIDLKSVKGALGFDIFNLAQFKVSEPKADLTHPRKER